MTPTATAAITSLVRFCQGVTAFDCTNPRATEGTESSEITLWLPYEAAVFQFRGSEVQEQAASLLGGGQITNDLRVVCWSGYGACFDFEDDVVEADEVDVIILPQWPTFVLNRARRLAPKRKLPLDELDLQGILVEDLEKPSAQDAVDFIRRANYRECSWILRRWWNAEHAATRRKRCALIKPWRSRAIRRNAATDGVNIATWLRP
jgi:hypothetical protein